MACGCSGSTPTQQQRRDTAAAAKAEPPRPRGTQAPGYYYTGPQKRAEQQERRAG